MCVLVVEGSEKNVGPPRIISGTALSIILYRPKCKVFGDFGSTLLPQAKLYGSIGY